MAKKRVEVQAAKMLAPDHVTIRLFAPGMSAMHRAGLGGLACTLKTLERQYRNGSLAQSQLPGPYVDGRPPWEITVDSVTLHFGKPELASPFLQKLFEYAFQLQGEGLIYLPGQSTSEPPLPVLADLQAGLTLTYLQHGLVRNLAKEATQVSYSPDSEGVPGIVVEYRKCFKYKHQYAWKELVNSNGTLTKKYIKVEGPISPGSVVRHVAYLSQTSVEEPVERMIALYFALVGCLALPVNRGVAVLLVPVVDDLLDFIEDRPEMTPMTAQACQIANAADAALQAQVRLRKGPRRLSTVAHVAKQQLAHRSTPGCHSMTFTPTPWASQQKSRVATLFIPPGDDRVFARFERALAWLPPRIAVRKIKESTGRGRKAAVVERSESFRVDSVVRPMIAENLALGRPWYAGFTVLMTKTNPATDKPYRKQVSYERKGLHAMISDPAMWDHEGEMLIVRSVHEAIRQTLGRIREETDGKSGQKLSQATKNRWERFREKLRMDLAGAKTASQLRFVLADLFSRGGNNSVLREGWTKVLPVLRTDWQLARDLGLLALASYAGKDRDEEENEPAH